MDVSGDNLPLLGDWPPVTPGTKAFLSTILGEGLLPSQNGKEVPMSVQEKQNSSIIVVDVGREGSNVHIAESDDLRLPKLGFRSGLADRMAARGGFSAPKLNTCELRSTNLSSSLDVKSHQIPLSPGFSPSTFLDSPVFMFNSLTQPSPTTGKFHLGQDDNTRSLSVPGFTKIIKDLPSAEVDAKPFAFQLRGEPNLYSSSATREVDSTVHHQRPLQCIDVSAQPALFNQTGSLDVSPGNLQDNHPLSGFTEQSVDFKLDNKSSDSTIGNENSPSPVDQLERMDQNEEFFSASDGQQSEEDGYNWRKYGQKLVKGSEFPRSYYKCTHLNCPVKKIVERDPNGQVTEIIYKGAHNHSMSMLSRRASCPSSHSFGDMKMDGPDSQGRQASITEGRPMWASNTDGRNNNMDATSASMTAEFNDPFISMGKEDCLRLESSSDALDVPSPLSNDGVIHCENEESEMKRRKLESSMIDMSAASRAVREPRVVVQTTSEVDILDDGYRWRKYGQKVVKGNPNPRSYYKCTSVGCTVRKHVERASHDLKFVITTYEGKHNHDVPAAKNSNHSTNASSGTTDILPQSHSVQGKQDLPHAQENFARFDMPTSMSNFNMLSGREQLLPPVGLSFDQSWPSLTSLEMAGLIPGDSMNVLTQMQPYLAQSTALGYMVRKVEPAEEQMIESSFPISNGGSVYQQMMGRLPLGPQM